MLWGVHNTLRNREGGERPLVDEFNPSLKQMDKKPGEGRCTIRGRRREGLWPTEMSARLYDVMVGNEPEAGVPRRIH